MYYVISYMRQHQLFFAGSSSGLELVRGVDAYDDLVTSFHRKQQVNSFESSRETVVPNPRLIRYLVLQLSKSIYKAHFIEFRLIIFGNAPLNPE